MSTCNLLRRNLQLSVGKLQLPASSCFFNQRPWCVLEILMCDRCCGNDAVVLWLTEGVDELASIESNEVVDFRKHMHDMCERTARARDSQVRCQSYLRQVYC